MNDSYPSSQKLATQVPKGLFSKYPKAYCSSIQKLPTQVLQTGSIKFVLCVDKLQAQHRRKWRKPVEIGAKIKEADNGMGYDVRPPPPPLSLSLPNGPALSVPYPNDSRMRDHAFPLSIL
eukprot:6183512-Pleurochrysis_carterae.AAC.1